MGSWIERKCAERGLRMTEQRKVIAKVLSDAAEFRIGSPFYR